MVRNQSFASLFFSEQNEHFSSALARRNNMVEVRSLIPCVHDNFFLFSMLLNLTC